MANCTMYKIIFNGEEMPGRYFSWDEANRAYHQLKESSIAGYGQIVQIS
ncbi:MAG: hypothetical protein J5691_00855 [Bacilli bacterium]|nr:hypothetical protein [Bacilli bacterium]